MRYALFVLTLILTFAPLTSHAAFGFTQIVPPECKCDSVEVVGAPAGTDPVSSAPAWGCVLQTIQNVIRVAIALGIAVATLALIYAGFVWMTSGGSPERRNQGSHLLINVFVGLAIMLGAWLIVDFVMKELYREPTEFGPWNNILAGNGDSANLCITARQPIPIATGTVDIVTGSPGTYVGGGANCPVPDPSSMVAIPASATQGDAESATSDTVRNFLAMREAALEDGVDLKVTDGYRTEAEQVSLWNNRGSVGTVAKPCSLGGNGSNHNSGEALDINVGCGNGNSSCNTRAYNWLKANGSRWNFRNAIPDDPLHWSSSGH